MSEIILEVKNLSKKYKINHSTRKYVAFRDILSEIISNPLLLLRKYNIFFNKNKTEDFWALKNINFSVREGEAIGIIGANGAGKSTLLKVLSEITPQTSGEIKITGKVASLLEVGTGFHPELSGRENIFLNGSILGMSKKEINKKIDDIVDFAGVEKFIDTPVKRYSSGMYVRLAFSVAAHMEPDILIVDEVLAVGDVEFQKKCLGRMNSVVKKTNKTIVFVSHDMSAIKNLCTKCILLDKGEIDLIGNTEDVIRKYLNKLTTSTNTNNAVFNKKTARSGKNNAYFTEIKIRNSENSKEIMSGDKLKITLQYTIKNLPQHSMFKFILVVYNESGGPILRLDSSLTKNSKLSIKKEGIIICETEDLNIAGGTYFFNIAIMENRELEDKIINAVKITIHNNEEKFNFNNKIDTTVDKFIVQHSFKSI